MCSGIKRDPTGDGGSIGRRPENRRHYTTEISRATQEGESTLRNNKANRTALTGILLALAAALSYLESLVPSVGLPGVKLGLSNVITMYALFFLGPAPALAIALLKSGLVLLMRGATAGLLSAAGGICSVAVMLLLNRLRASKGLTSVAGAMTHNFAQLAVAALLLRSAFALYMLPLLAISGIGMGAVTALVFGMALPALQRLGLQGRQTEPDD